MTTFAESLGFKKGDMVPFAAAPYSLNLLGPDDPQSKKLQGRLLARVNDNFSGLYKNRKHTVINVPFSLILLAKNPKGPHLYAGVGDTQMHFSASLLKPGVMYAAFELLAAANRIAAANHITDVATLGTQMNAAFKAKLARYPFDGAFNPLTPNCPQYTRIFKFVPNPISPADPFVAFDTTTNFGPHAQPGGFEANLEDMIAASGNDSAAAAIDALGFTYINCALAAGGFFTERSVHHRYGHGIWIAGDYGGLEAKPRLVNTLNDGPGKLAMDTSTMSQLFALIELGQLVDGISSATMQTWLAETFSTIPPNDPPFITRDDDDNTIVVDSFDVVRNKLGKERLGRPATATTPSTLGASVFSECSVLQWKTDLPEDATTVTNLSNAGFSDKVIVCWQNFQANQPDMSFDSVRDVVIDTVQGFATGTP